MLRLAVLMLGSVDQAEDVVQDAFAAVGDRWGSLENPGGYLRTCVVNGCRQVLRDRERRTRRLASLVPTPPGEELPVPDDGLHRALARLSPRQRAVVILRYLEDRPDAEIAGILSCRPSTVRSLARRALRRLRRELE